MICDCYYFRQKLVNFSKDLLAEENEEPQWQTFKQFLINYFSNDLLTLSLNDGKEGLCTFMVLPRLVRELDEFRRYAIELPTLLVDLMTILYSASCFRYCRNWINGFQRFISFTSDHETLGVLRVVGSLRPNRDCNLIKLLLNFNFLPSLPGNSPRLTKEMYWELSHFISCLEDLNYRATTYIHQMQLFPKCEETVTRAVNLIKTFNLGEDGYINKRIFLSVKALMVVSLTEAGKTDIAENLRHCLHMYFTGTTDSIISSFEICCVLYCCLHVLKKYELFEVYGKHIKNIFPEFPLGITPRRLSDLSRCQIRLGLRSSDLPLPSAIDKLNLPRRLNYFVLGDVRDLAREKKD